MADTAAPGQSGKERNEGSGSGTFSIIDAKLIEEGSKPCLRCGHKLNLKEGNQDWPGLPAGVKFDPTDQELLEHLEAKVELNGRKPHPLIDEFIPTLEGEDGICYTHPEKLPGVTRDGHSRHFFHRPSKAYTTGTRKRRKIQSECDLQGGETRWHKTGKTRPVLLNGKQKGCKKILVLYTNFGKQRKPEKTNWVMHQYHLGSHEDEKEGELVVSKVFYQTQPRQCSWDRLPTPAHSNSSRLPQPEYENVCEAEAEAEVGLNSRTALSITPSAASSVNRVFSLSGLCQQNLDEGISESSSRCEDDEHQRQLTRSFPKSQKTSFDHNVPDKLPGRTSSLEDLFEIKEAGASALANSQEVEWINYNTSYWPNAHGLENP
eukprot:TRINITY_DN6493_c0_g1_i2.p1 TRINITY_DN6493_c0_g1~~TRINITY_DN6493_c0_g1_i2.p1  ORF type:complete len:376 (+),score=38.92 TRINITY_DN6493_c0_g1_i2:672-1799(+)